MNPKNTARKMKKYVDFSVKGILFALVFVMTSCLSDGDETISLEFANVKKMIVGEWVLESASGTPRVLTFTDDGYYTDSSDGGTKKHPWRLASDYSEGTPYYGGIYLDGVYYEIVSLGDGHWRLKDKNGKILDFGRNGITNSGEDSDVSKLIISANSVSLKKNEFATIEITSGSGSYSLTNSNPEYATAVLHGSTIRITAITVGSTTITVQDKKNNQTVTIKVTVINKEDDSQAKAVDLGIGKLWADRNVGATKPEDFGDYFAWGETIGYNSGKKNFNDWRLYKWSNSSHAKTFYITKYNYVNKEWGQVDGKKSLDLEDDAAYVNMGSQWRIPYPDEIEKLIKQCTWTWEEVNGVNGYKITGPNKNSIFLPAAGYHREDFYKNVGVYWSRMHATRCCNAYSLYFTKGKYEESDFYRMYGLSIRPVLR